MRRIAVNYSDRRSAFDARAPGGQAIKFSWFHLMPYRWLPDDFRQKYHSVFMREQPEACAKELQRFAGI